jgi:hypothetical protein
MPGSSNRFKIHISKENPTLAEKDCTGFLVAENNYELHIWRFTLLRLTFMVKCQ